MKKVVVLTVLAVSACSKTASAPAEATVSFEGNGKAAATAPSADSQAAPSANYVRGAGLLTIYLFGAVPPDTARQQFALQIGAYHEQTGQVRVANAVFTRKNEAKREYQYSAKNDTFKVAITDIDLHDIPGSPLREGTISGTFDGELAYTYPNKDGTEYTAPLKITNGKFENVKITAAK